jgi:hypothetical protein
MSGRPSLTRPHGICICTGLLNVTSWAAANILWAHATMGRRPGEGVLGALEAPLAWVRVAHRCAAAQTPAPAAAGSCSRRHSVLGVGSCPRRRCRPGEEGLGPRSSAPPYRSTNQKKVGSGVDFEKKRRFVAGTVGRVGPGDQSPEKKAGLGDAFVEESIADRMRHRKTRAADAF